LQASVFTEAFWRSFLQKTKTLPACEPDQIVQTVKKAPGARNIKF